EWQDEEWAKFESLLSYVTLDATDSGADWPTLRKLVAADDGRPRVFYLATAPRLYIPICEALGKNDMICPTCRVVLEKPIGTDLASAVEINEGVGRVFDENMIYRIDHYLGKETVQNLMVLRFANTLLEPVWSRNAVDHVQITVSETLGLEGRADYYARSGALRDMVQNHLLQLLCLTAMEPPGALTADSVRMEKIKVLRALHRFDQATAKSNTVRAQYVAGQIGGEVVKGFAEELSDKSEAAAETFVAIKTYIDNWRWAGVPFYLRTGKRLSERRSEIVVQFKETPVYLFGDAMGQRANRLVIRLQPDEGVHLYMQIKEPGPGGLRIKSLPLNLSYADNFTIRYPDAYERLLMDVVRGNLALFIQREEVETAWKWVDGLIEAWDDMDGGMETYPAGSAGPAAADFMMRKDNRTWWEGAQ
ncbi:MAG: glucose-6-phosphate dehydrogenase, partial [Pseudomonadota bacterium]